MDDRKAAVPLSARQRMAGVDAERQVLRLDFFVNRKEMGIGHLAVEVEAALEDRAGAVRLRPADLLGGFIRIEQRQHRRPAEPAARRRDARWRSRSRVRPRWW